MFDVNSLRKRKCYLYLEYIENCIINVVCRYYLKFQTTTFNFSFIYKKRRITEKLLPLQKPNGRSISLNFSSPTIKLQFLFLYDFITVSSKTVPLSHVCFRRRRAARPRKYAFHFPSTSRS